MKDRYDRVTSAIRHMAEIQAKHAQEFDNALLPDLEEQNAQRDEGMERLKQEAEAFIVLAEQAPSDQTESMMRSLSSHIKVLLRQNEVLTSKVMWHRDRLRQSMKGLVKGKRAIGAYRPPAYVSNRPRVINLSN